MKILRKALSWKMICKNAKKCYQWIEKISLAFRLISVSVEIGRKR